MTARLNRETTTAHIDWSSWQPQQRATLLFVIRDGNILLIRKKRGLGAGKINGPGGRIEPRETAESAAIREVEEELCTTPRNVLKCGELFFQFIAGLSLHCQVFKASDCTLAPQETDEAVPLWCSTDQIPYAEMWADDCYWFPMMLRDTPFTGYFVFDADDLLDHHFADEPTRVWQQEGQLF